MMEAMRNLPGCVALVLGAAIAACAPDNDTGTLINTDQIVCPTTEYLNCMPIVPLERQQICSAASREWIGNNCPDVTIVY